MKNPKKVIIFLISITIINFLLPYQIGYGRNIDNNSILMQNKEDQVINNISLKSTSSTKTNYEIIQEIFSRKLSDYTTTGYFPQIYTPSLQATYYAVYALNALNNLDQINKTEIKNYIISHYNTSTQMFMDDYSFRYMDAHPPYSLYPMSSLLEVHCYAILCLELLDSLNSIDVQESIDFIWSCLNPEEQYNGFIGQPYNFDLPMEYKVATMDNTYYAIEALNVLLNNWDGYGSEKSRIVQFINSLQSTSNHESSFGAFYNDNNHIYDTLELEEPNLLSSYYCLKILELFNSLDTVRIDDFHQYLNNIYNENEHYFRIHYYDNEMDIVASSIGLELSDITGYTNISRINLIQFILNNRNGLGNWDRGIECQYHELIDTYRIIKSLKQSGVIFQMSEQEKDNIVGSLEFYRQFNGYSLLSEDYTSMDLLHTIVNSFDLYYRIFDLDISAIYNQIEESVFYNIEPEYETFLSCTNMDKQPSLLFRSLPIEYYYFGEGNGIYLKTHKNTYKALDCLNKIYKLDDFSMEHDLIALMNSIIGSQFLDSNYDGYGAFLPNLEMTLFSNAFQNNKIYLEFSYYAVKALELISNFLNLGGIYNVSFNKGALYGYLTRNINETDSLQYFNSKNALNVEKILKDTYYMVYTLKALNLYDLNSQKIRNFVVQNINYQNIENIYYSYKISEILNLDIEFNHNLTHSLIKALYSDDLNEIYTDTTLTHINQENFLYICEISKNENLKIECDYLQYINLGNVNTITVSFSNTILDDFGPLISVKFESEQLGIQYLEKQMDNFYQLNLLVPIDSDCFPQFGGVINIFDGSELIGQESIMINTNFEQSINHNALEENEIIQFSVNISRKFSYESLPVCNSNVQVDVFRNNFYIETRSFTRQDFSNHSCFQSSYQIIRGVSYYFNITLVDDFYPEGLFLFDYDTQSIPEIPPPIDNDEPKFGGVILAVSGSVITGLTLITTVKIGRKIKSRKFKDSGKIESSKNTVQEEPSHNVLQNLKDSLFEDWE